MKKMVWLVFLLLSNGFGFDLPLAAAQVDKAATVTPGKINLVWQPTADGNNNMAELPKLAGVNVVSPSWFAIIRKNGLLESKSDAAYVSKAQAKGYQVWPLLTNSFDPELTHELLQNKKFRQYVVQQLLFYGQRDKFDGINLDFENVYDEDRAALSEFVQEITAGLRSEAKIVSIDVTVPSATPNWSNCYDRKVLGQTVDYVMLMAYDEHWRSSKISGSVASIGWVENGLQNTLRDIPAEKVVLGLPFYMRLWEEQNGEVVSAKTLTMPAAKRLIAEKHLLPAWLPGQGQYYFEYSEKEARYRVWQEDTRSIASKAALVAKYNLAGTASWRKGFEETAVWPVLEQAIKAPAASRDLAETAK